MKFVLEMEENIVGKGENDGYQHFFSFHNIFKWLHFQGHSKSGLCGEELSPLSTEHGSPFKFWFEPTFKSLPHNPDF